MNGFRVLDCTLRDGGYCNNWQFGNRNIKKITSRLCEAGIDIIECGFLTKKVSYDAERSLYTDVSQIAQIIPAERKERQFVCMVNYGEYRAEQLPPYDGSSVDGIRVAFHKKNMVDALKLCEEIKAKGYKVFVQAMASLTYTDVEYLDLISRINALEPYAFYIVDSFGLMKRKDLIRLFYMVEHNLRTDIIIGFHSHNNMQLAYSNAQTLVDIRSRHSVIIDSSVFGMGRGAGNLNTELFVEYLNDNINSDYNLKPILSIIDEILTVFYKKNYWGYSLPNYLSAKHDCHPNYAGYLDEKNTLTVESMDEIFSMMDDSKRANYDKTYIEDLYTEYMETGRVKEAHVAEFRERIKDAVVLIIAPGKSSIDEKDKVIACASLPGVVSIAVNFDYKEFNTDYIFLSNLRRFRELPENTRKKCIVTSNVPSKDVYIQTDYSELLNQHEGVRDNAGMMLIRFLILSGSKKIALAGFDGYSPETSDNYAYDDMNLYARKTAKEALNDGINACLREYSGSIEIEFVTTPRHISI